MDFSDFETYFWLFGDFWKNVISSFTQAGINSTPPPDTTYKVRQGKNTSGVITVDSNGTISVSNPGYDYNDIGEFEIE